MLQKNYESVISQYKKKLEDAQELRKKLKAMEEKNMMYMQQNMDLEEVGVIISIVTRQSCDGDTVHIVIGPYIHVGVAKTEWC